MVWHLFSYLYQQNKYNMTSRYKTLDTLSLFQHQANHYKNIINPKRPPLFPQHPQENNNNFLASGLKSKHAKQLQRVLKLENRRMLKELMHLDKKKGLMQKAEENYRNFTSQSKRLSLVNPYRAKYQQTQRQNQNKTLQLKCKGTEPNIGRRQQWAKHQIFTKKIVNRLSNKSPFSKQVKDTQVFMEMMQTKDRMGWTDILLQNKEKEPHKNQKKKSTKRKSKSMLNKRRRNLSNLQKVENLNEQFLIQNEESKS